MDDKTLKHLVSEELDYDPSLDKCDIGVSCQDGIVTLRGEVAFLAQKYTADKAATRVQGVRAIANEIEVNDLVSNNATDHEIAKRAADILSWATCLQGMEVKTHVSGGCLTLSGEVRWDYQRKRARELITGLNGVRAILNNITLKPIAHHTDIVTGIKKALHRNAEVEADSIHVVLQKGGTVVLQGDVKAWHERELVTAAAWSTPGVTDVIDQLTIG